MNRKIVYAILSASLLCANCAKDEAGDSLYNEVVSTREFMVELGDASTKATSQLDGEVINFKWQSSDKLGGYVDATTFVEFSTSDFSGDGSTAKFKGEIDDNAQKVRFIYPYSASALEDGKYSIDLSTQSDTFAGQYESVAKSAVLINEDAIDITGSDFASIAMKHLTASMQFNFSFPADFAATKLTSLKISGLPTAAKADMSKASSANDILTDNTTAGTLTINAGGLDVVGSTNYSLEAAIIPFSMEAEAELAFEAVLENGFEYKGTVKATEAKTFAAGKYHTVAVGELNANGVCRMVGAAANDAEQIVISFSAPTTLSGDVPYGLTVTRNEVAVDVTAAELNVDGNKLTITVEGGVWNGDDVAVSYAGTDLGDAPEFAGEVVKPYIVNLILNGDFESGDSDIKSYDPNKNYILTEPQYSNIISDNGNKCLQVLDPDGAVANLYYQSSKMPMKYGVDYRLEYRYRVASMDAAEWPQIYMEKEPGYNQFNSSYLAPTVSENWSQYPSAEQEAGSIVKFEAPAPVDGQTAATEYLGVFKLAKFPVAFELLVDDIVLYEYKRHE